jgi:ribosomal-protein-alanine N-acetyltransferase
LFVGRATVVSIGRMEAIPREYETRRLRLRPPRVADAEAIYAEYARDPAVTKFLTWKPYREIEPLRHFLERLVAECASPLRGAWVITLKPNDHPVGMFDGRVDGHRFTFGYVLTRRCWGCGYMVEALQPLVDWALAQPEIHRVWAFCDLENRSSARVLEKLGLEEEGVLRRWFVHPNISDTPRDCRCFSRVSRRLH